MRIGAWFYDLQLYISQLLVNLISHKHGHSLRVSSNAHFQVCCYRWFESHCGDSPDFFLLTLPRPWARFPLPQRRWRRRLAAPPLFPRPSRNSMRFPPVRYR